MRKIITAAVVAVTALTGCGGISFDAQAGQHIPADAVRQSFYMRNTTDAPHFFMIIGEHEPPVEGPVRDRPASTGCGKVGRDWELIVWQTATRPDPADEEVHRVSGDAFGHPDEMALWLSIEPDGVQSGEGVPDWWDSDIQRCP